MQRGSVLDICYRSWDSTRLSDTKELEERYHCHCIQCGDLHPDKWGKGRPCGHHGTSLRERVFPWSVSYLPGTICILCRFHSPFPVNWLVCKIPSRFETKLYNRWKVRPQESIDPPKETSHFYLFPLVLILLIGIGIYIHLYGSPRPVPPKRALVEFPMTMPMTIDDWQGQSSTWLSGDQFFPGVDNGLTRTYRNASGREINLYIGYFASQRHGKSLINYHANPLREGIRRIPTGLVDPQPGPGPGPGPQTVNLSYPRIDGTPYVALFWYRFPSGELTQRVQTKLKGITDAIIHRRNNGAVILLATIPANKGEEKSATNDLLSFARILAPALQEYLP